MQWPSWRPQCVRSLASPCCARRLADGNPPGCCNYDVQASDVRHRSLPCNVGTGQLCEELQNCKESQTGIDNASWKA